MGDIAISVFFDSDVDDSDDDVNGDDNYDGLGGDDEDEDKLKHPQQPTVIY